MDLPPHPPQAEISMTIRMIEKVGIDVMLFKRIKAAPGLPLFKQVSILF